MQFSLLGLLLARWGLARWGLPGGSWAEVPSQERGNESRELGSPWALRRGSPKRRKCFGGQFCPQGGPPWHLALFWGEEDQKAWEGASLGVSFLP